MAYFDDLNRVVNKVMEMMLKNKDLLEILVYPEPSTKMEREDVLMKNIFPMPRSYEATKDEKSFINVYIDSSYPYEENRGFNHMALCFDVVSHLSIWSDGNSNIRPYQLCSEIDKMLNNQKNDDVREISINPPQLFEMRIYRYGEVFYGYKLKYHISADSNCNKVKDKND